MFDGETANLNLPRKLDLYEVIASGGDELD